MSGVQVAVVLCAGQTGIRMGARIARVRKSDSVFVLTSEQANLMSNCSLRRVASANSTVSVILISFVDGVVGNSRSCFYEAAMNQFALCLRWTGNACGVGYPPLPYIHHAGRHADLSPIQRR